MRRLVGMLVFTCLFFLFSSVVYADPVVNFSDIIQGPKSGLGDGLGQGAIVTIWGERLGATKGTSKVYVKDSLGVSREAAYTYYWQNATGSKPGGPANVYDYHKMQEIAFSIPSASADGAGKIYVTVGGVNSNELDFAIKSTGTFRFIKTSGTDSGAGTWSSPWHTMDYATNQGATAAGDIVYACDGVSSSATVEVINKLGTPTNRFALVAYPNSAVTITSTGGGFHNYNISSAAWTFSKITINAVSTAVGNMAYGRFTGLEITGSNADNQSGAIGWGGQINSADDLKIFGNYIHNYGSDSSGNLCHIIYGSHRSYDVNPVDPICHEIGWNYFKDNKCRGGIHWYDEHACGGCTGTAKVHDNVLINQVWNSIDFQCSTAACFSGYSCRMTAEVYNNLIVNGGIPNGAGNYAGFPIDLFGDALVGSGIKIYNNTIYGYSTSSCNAANYGACQAIRAENVTGEPWSFVNNIIVDTQNQPWYYTSGWVNPTVSSNNIWYNGGDGNPASPPSWDTSPITSNPLFMNPSLGDFRLMNSSSPAFKAGISMMNRRDIIGVIRPAIPSIGAFEYDSGAIPPMAPVFLSVQ